MMQMKCAYSFGLFKFRMIHCLKLNCTVCSWTVVLWPVLLYGTTLMVISREMCLLIIVLYDFLSHILRRKGLVNWSATGFTYGSDAILIIAKF